MTMLSTILARQNCVVDDDEYDRMKAARRMTNVANSRALLAQNDLVLDEDGSGPDGVRFFVGIGPRDEWGCISGEVVGYLPEVGRWFDKDMKARYGCRNLIKYLKGETLC